MRKAVSQKALKTGTSNRVVAKIATEELADFDLVSPVKQSYINDTETGKENKK